MTESAVRSYSALRDTQREFETTIIIRPDINKEGIADLVTRLQRVYTRNSGRMQKIDNWGLRTLAYPIQGHKKGIYLYVRYLGGSDMVQELERNLRIWDEIIRYLTVLVDADVDPDARPSDVDERASTLPPRSRPIRSTSPPRRRLRSPTITTTRTMTTTVTTMTTTTRIKTDG